MNISFTSARAFAAAAALTACLIPQYQAHAATLQVNALAPGYTASSCELGVAFGGSIAVNPAQPNILYISYGPFGAHRLLEFNTDTGTTRTLTQVLGNVGGIAVLANGDLAITENFSSDTTLRARDLDNDGTFLQTGEISPLIGPILHDGDFTGAQLITAPPANAESIPAGALIIQTADGATSSELLVVDNPEAAPAYRAPASPFFSGFTYNGGIAFTPQGHLLCGISEFPAGRVVGLVNTNGDLDIDPGESHDIVGTGQLGNSISDLAVTAEGTLLVSENSGNIRQFALPANLLTGSAQPGGNLVETNGGYISSLKLANPSRPFQSGVPGPPAILYLSGYIGFSQASNLLAIKPLLPTAASAWEIYE